MVILLIVLVAIEIVPSFKNLYSNSLRLSRRTKARYVSKAIYTPRGTLGNEQDQELLLESLTLLRDIMNDISQGSEKKFRFVP